jgi:hypothetical protein
MVEGGATLAKARRALRESDGEMYGLTRVSPCRFDGWPCGWFTNFWGAFLRCRYGERPGFPRDYDDLLRPGLRVVTTNVTTCTLPCG